MANVGIGIIGILVVVASFLGYLLRIVISENKENTGAKYQIAVGKTTVVWDFASFDEAKSFAHGIISREREKGEEVKTIKINRLYDQFIEPISLSEAFRVGRMVSDMTAREYLTVKGW